MKPWQLGDGDNTVATEQLRMEFIFDSINRQLQSIGVTDQTTFDAFANYIGYSTGGTPSYQDMQVAWTPTSAKAGEIIGFFNYGNLDPLETLVFTQTTNLAGWDLEVSSTLQSISYPNLLSIDPTNITGGYLWISDHSALTTVSAPLLASVSPGGSQGVIIQNNPLLTTINLSALATSRGIRIHDNAITALDLHSLTSLGTGLSIYSNTALVSLNLSSFVPANGQNIALNLNALNVASVDQALARCIVNPTWGNAAETLQLDGGTNSAPSSIAPGSDYAILVARGAAITVNP